MTFHVLPVEYLVPIKKEESEIPADGASVIVSQRMADVFRY